MDISFSHFVIETTILYKIYLGANEEHRLIKLSIPARKEITVITVKTEFYLSILALRA